MHEGRGTHVVPGAERRWGRTGRAVLAAVLVGVGLVAAACGSSNTSSTKKTTSTTRAAAATTTAPATTTAAAATTPAASSGLSGKWSGQYSGAYSGTFTLNWRQSGSVLAGTIALSNPGGTLGIHGSVSGSTIKFGTVGGPGITYTGSVSGSSMSGSYQTPTGSGSWSANKS